jgi:DNA-binding NtrC family response regulator
MDAFCRVVIDVPLGTSLEEIKEKAIDAVLDITNGSKEKTAEALGISQQTLLRRLGKRSLERIAKKEE